VKVRKLCMANDYHEAFATGEQAPRYGTGRIKLGDTAEVVVLRMAVAAVPS
jgi:hypothetical protein